MSAPCANCPTLRKQKKTAAIHGKQARLEGWGHEYGDKTPSRMNGISKDKRAYQQSEAHRDAMVLSKDATVCWPAAFGAPGECFGGITPSHTLSVGQAGSQEKADQYPVPPACAWHNDAMEQDPEVREWATRTFFTVGNRQYPFKISNAWLTAEREGQRI